MSLKSTADELRELVEELRVAVRGGHHVAHTSFASLIGGRNMNPCEVNDDDS